MLKYKTCTKCGQQFPNTHEFFYTEKRKSDGLTAQCKTCRKATRAKYCNENRELIRQQNRDDYYRDPEKTRHRRQVTYYNHREQRKQYSRNYYQSHRDQMLAQSAARAKQRRDEINHNRRKNYAINPILVRLQAQRRRARTLSLPDTLTEDEALFAYEYFDNHCAVCGRAKGDGYTIVLDHWIPLASPNCPGTIAGNLIPLCHGKGGCNNSKHTRDPHDWLLSHFGAHEASQIESRIALYFDSIPKQA